MGLLGFMMVCKNKKTKIQKMTFAARVLESSLTRGRGLA